ncbi:unnamed protein product [Hymenolepis diminuta]|uniref:Uncharacterized protein n=1 Tax=Hymenolepis diminuta TaxID=6216 RepID=A0A158QDX9_HYMDI|nr:unnamed protein product [Hymenolepis diminuta]
MTPIVLILIDPPPVYTLPPFLTNSNGEEGTAGAGFNVVRKKQLERLNYRSNWFLSPPSGLRQAGLMRVDPLSPGTPRSCSKLAKSEEGEAAIRKYSPTEESVDLRRKPSNRQLQHLLSPAANEAGLPPSLFINAHLPSSSRQFTLDPSTVPHDSFDGDAEDDQGPPTETHCALITEAENRINAIDTECSVQLERGFEGVFLITARQFSRVRTRIYLC